MKILIIDDNATVRRIIRKVLYSAGYVDIIEAANGYDALRKLTPTVGLILVNWRMPVMDGLTFVTKTRNLAAHFHTPIIMISNEHALQDVKNAFESGVNDYIIRPFTPEVLMEKITQFANKPGKDIKFPVSGLKPQIKGKHTQ